MSSAEFLDAQTTLRALLFLFPPKQKKCVSHLHQLWVKSYLFELLGMCRFMRVGAEVRVTRGWLILTQVDSSLAALMYFATHVQGIGEHLKWSPFLCENILLAVKLLCRRQYVRRLQEQLVPLSPGIWNNSRLNSSWDSFIKVTCPFVIFLTVKLY